MRKFISKLIMISALFTLITLIPTEAKAEDSTKSTTQLDNTDITIKKIGGATVKLNGVEVSQIIPNEYNFVGDPVTTYDVVLPVSSYLSPARIIIPVVVKEEGYLAVELNGSSINEHVYTGISRADGEDAPHFFSIGSFLDSDSYNVSRGATIFEPGVYYISASVYGSSMAQEFNISATFTKTANLKMVNNKNMLISGMDEKGIFMEVDSSKYGGKLTLTLDAINKDYGYNTSYLHIALCDSSKKQIVNNVCLQNTGDKATWTLGSGTYFLRMSNPDSLYSIKPEFKPFLKTPTIDKVAVNSTVITGTASKGTTVIVKVGAKKYTTTAAENGNYKIKVMKLTKNKVISVYIKNSNGLYSKTKTVVVK